MAEKKKDLTFDQMYDRLEMANVPEKVSGRPVCRSEREYLQQLKDQDEQS